MIVAQGLLNTTALVVPDLYVQIVPPQNLSLNGVPSNDYGLVGTASYGPVGVPTTVGNPAQYAQNFGPIMPRTYDMGTYVAIGSTLGANNFTCVRATDGTDVAASAVVGSINITFTALYTGSTGNGITVVLSAGSVSGTFNALVTLLATGQSELFTNIGGTGNAFWVNLAAAINNGQGAFRGKSAVVSAVAGSGTTAPAAQTIAFTGGTDGASGVSATTLLGTDAAPRKGMYALRKQGCAIAALCDAATSSQWTTMAAFGLSEGIYMVDAFPAASGSLPSQNIATNVTTLNGTGAASYALKIMHGDWLYWYDTGNQVTRLVSPAAFAAGQMANMAPQNSPLNSQIYGIIGSQQCGAPGTSQGNTYSGADLQALTIAGIDVITNPAPGGNYYACRNGYNTSYPINPGTGRDTYTRMTNYIAATLNAGMGYYVGKLINTTLFGQIAATLTQFLNNMLQQGQLAVQPDTGALPFTVVCNGSNNPFSRTMAGYVQADVQVQFQAVNEKFIVNLQGGQTVTVSSVSQQAQN